MIALQTSFSFPIVSRVLSGFLRNQSSEALPRSLAVLGCYLPNVASSKDWMIHDIQDDSDSKTMIWVRMPNEKAKSSIDTLTRWWWCNAGEKCNTAISLVRQGSTLLTSQTRFLNWWLARTPKDFKQASQSAEKKSECWWFLIIWLVIWSKHDPWLTVHKHCSQR